MKRYSGHWKLQASSSSTRTAVAQGSVCESGNRKKANSLFVQYEGSAAAFFRDRAPGPPPFSSMKFDAGGTQAHSSRRMPLGVTYRSLGCVPRSRTLGPPPFSSMNCTPAISSTRRMPGGFVSLAVSSVRRMSKQATPSRLRQTPTRRSPRKAAQSPIWNAKGPLAREACAGYLTCVLLYDASTRLWRLPKN